MENDVISSGTDSNIKGPKGNCDLAVIGAGSGGFGAALAAARLGMSVNLIEKNALLGGNAVHGGVHNWEMAAGATGIPFDLYREMRRTPGAAAVTSFGRHMLYTPLGQTPFPGGEIVVDHERTYLDTLQRHGTRGITQDEAVIRGQWHSIVFEPDACDRAMRRMLEATGRCTVLTGVKFNDVHHRGGRITGLDLSDGSTVRAEAFVDATADALLVQATGHPMRFGQDAYAAYQEPNAPVTPTNRINGVTLIYRVSPIDEPAVESLPAGIPARCWWADQFPVAAFTQYPCGDYNVNMLPTMDGREARRRPYPDTYAECQRRVRSHWHDLQTRFPEFRGYRLSWVAPTLGVREGPRIVGRYTLTQHDLLAGLSGQSHDDVIALADHAMDFHGATDGSPICPELAQPYGVPLRCLIPSNLDNVYVACRGASFSAIAASSCRLSRTMMQLGQAAGTAAAVAMASGTTLPDVDPGAVRNSLRRQHVQLDHPLPDSLIETMQRHEVEHVA